MRLYQIIKKLRPANTEEEWQGVAADCSWHVDAFRCEDAHSQQQQVIHENAVQVGVS